VIQFLGLNLFLKSMVARLTLHRRGVLAWPLAAFLRISGAAPATPGSPENEVAALAREAASFADADLRRLIWRFCIFDIPEASALLDRLHPPSLSGAEAMQRDNLRASLRAAALVRKALQKPSAAADLSPGALGLSDGASAASPQAMPVLLKVLEQLDDLQMGPSGFWAEPSPASERASRSLEPSTPRKPNATRAAIVQLMKTSVETGVLQRQQNLYAVQIANFAAQLGEVALTRTALKAAAFNWTFYKGPPADLANDMSYAGLTYLTVGDLEGAIGMLDALPDFRIKFSLWSGVVMLEIKQKGAAVGFKRLRVLEAATIAQLAGDEVAAVNAITTLAAIRRSAGDDQGALDLARRAVVQFDAQASRGLYGFAMLSVLFHDLGDRDAARALCLRGHELYRLAPKAEAARGKSENPLPAGYVQSGPAFQSDHCYLAFAAYWSGLGEIFADIAAKVPPENREVFWIWFVLLATDLSKASPADEAAVRGGGAGVWTTVIRRSLVLGKNAQAASLLPEAIEAVASSNDPRRFIDLGSMATLARRKQLPRFADQAFARAEQSAGQIAIPFARVDALLSLAVAKRNAERR
jgi:hypothetical protein